MYRIVGARVENGKRVGGVLLSGEVVENEWDVYVFESNGHRELSARQVVRWTELGDNEEHFDACGNPVLDLELTPEQLEEERMKNCKRAARRATTQCRRAIKASSFNELLTITYREDQQDRELAKKHFKEWVRRMKRAIPNFQYVASFERQDRGAVHMHVATHKLPTIATYKGVKIAAWKLGTKVWRSIVGEDNGLVFVGAKTRWGLGGQRKLSQAKMAAYVSKYIMKDYAESPLGSNRYSRSSNIDVPKPTCMRLVGCDLGQLIGVAFERPEGSVIVSHRIGRFDDTYWLCTEPGSQ